MKRIEKDDIAEVEYYIWLELKRRGLWWDKLIYLESITVVIYSPYDFSTKHIIQSSTIPEGYSKDYILRMIYLVVLDKILPDYPYLQLL